MTEAKAPSDAIPITVNGRVIDPHDHYAKNAHETDHVVLTLYDVLTREQHAKLEALEVQVQEDLGESTYLCRYERSSLDPLRALGWVRQVDVYRNKFKIPEELLGFIQKTDKNARDADEGILINVMPHHEISDALSLDGFAADVATTAGISRNDVQVLTGKVQLEVKVGQIQKIAENGNVRVIEQVLVPDLSDGQANHLVLGQSQVQSLEPFRGENQIISVIDTGFDLGNQENCHPAFEGRIEKLLSLGRANQDLPTEAERYNDPDGHGTHVCGTIVGHPISTSEGLVGGVAPLARLVVSSVMIDNRKRTPINDINEAFGRPYREHQARIFSNSWGDNLAGSSQRQYRDDTGFIDAFVRDNPDALVIFSAGNNNLVANPANYHGPLRPAVGSQAAAKNVLTVGASGSTRVAPDQRTGLSLLDPDKIYPESSRGRTKESRTKPDVVAPGFSIFSARSRHSAVKYGGFQAGSNEHPREVTWQTRSGTSHATPLVAGCAAILRQMAQKSGCENPPAALLKAVIINGADKLPGVDQAAQGFGRVNLLASAEMLQEKPFISHDMASDFRVPMQRGTLIGAAMVQGDVFEMNLDLNIPNQSQSTPLELKVTLVYNDMKGAAVHNNLNLTVIDTFTGEVQNGFESEDDMLIQNNVEQVVLSSMPPNPLKVTVKAQKIFPGATQDFVLAWALLRPYTGTQGDIK